jgi:phosphoglycerate dehydrogenase-like enzyme
VFENEPLPVDSPLWAMDNVIVTPHMAAISPAYLDRAVKLFVDNLTRYIQNARCSTSSTRSKVIDKV